MDRIASGQSVVSSPTATEHSEAEEQSVDFGQPATGGAARVGTSLTEFMPSGQEAKAQGEPAEFVSRTARYANRSQDVAFNASGQVIGLVNEVRSTRDVIYTLVEEYFEAVERLQKLAPQKIDQARTPAFIASFVALTKRSSRAESPNSSHTSTDSTR